MSEKTPLLQQEHHGVDSGPGGTAAQAAHNVAWSRVVGRRLGTAIPTFALRRNSIRGTERLVPSMGKLGSFLFLSNLITGAWRGGRCSFVGA